MAQSESTEEEKPSPVESQLKRSQKNWAILVQGAVWVLGILSGFLMPPPVGVAPGDEKLWVRLAQFIVAVVVGLLLLASMRWGKSRHATAWWATSMVFLVVGILGFLRYQQLLNSHTVPYAEERVVIGSEITVHAREYARENPDLSDRDLVMHFAGRTDQIWTRESINRNRFNLSAIYILCLPLFTVCLMSIVQAIQCQSKKKEG